jgi:hypothetical protein
LDNLASHTLTRAQIESWLSSARFKSYLRAAQGNDFIALDLYLWNTGLAQAVLKDISFFEIALRNAYADCLASNLTCGRHWFIDDSSPIRKPILRKNKRKQQVDVNRLNRNTIDHLVGTLGKDATPDDVISNLTLGFWTHMTDTSHERDLWIPIIHKVWHTGTVRKDIHATISKINIVRNRAAHHEHLFSDLSSNCNTSRLCADAVKLFAELQPEAAYYIYGKSLTSTVDTYIKNNPAPCLIYA